MTYEDYYEEDYKDYEKISEIAEEVKETEFHFLDILNKKISPKFKNFKFEINEDKYGNKDYFLLYNGKRVLNVEYENGITQNLWDNEFSDNLRWFWHYGLNLVVRKKYNKNFQLFIKSSPTYNSWFAIDTTNHFIKNYEHTKKQLPKTSLRTGRRDNWVYSINWDEVGKHEFIVEKKENRINVIKNDRICLIENNDFRKFNAFFYVRFLRPYFNIKIKQ